MLFKNGIDLQDELISFLSYQPDCTIIVPYVKNEKFKELMNVCNGCSQLVVRWEPRDILQGASDLEVFDTCQNLGITLYRNHRIHFKAFVAPTQKCFMGSANISERAINDGASANYNYELATVVKKIDFDSNVYFQNIILESTLVTKEYVELLKKQVERIPNPMNPPDDFAPIEEGGDEVDKNFLLSSLPMTSTIEVLKKIYDGARGYEEEEINCAAHDIALYGVPKGLSSDEVYSYLKVQFNSHAFVLRLKEFIAAQEKKSLNYGGVVRWIQNNTTTVPTPRSWEIKQQQIVNILYLWICEFDSNFHWDRPNHSEIIYYSG